MQQYLVEAVTAYQAGDFERALTLLSHMPDGAMPLQALALKANIFARRGEAQAAGETFLKAARMPGADRALLLRLAGRMLEQAGETAHLAEAGVEILQSVQEDSALASAILGALLSVGRSAEAADFVPLLDTSDPAQVMLGVAVLRAAKRIEALPPLLDAALRNFPTDGMLNAERFNAAQDLCDFDTQADCLRRIMDETDDAGQNMFAAQSLHRRLMWSDDEGTNRRPGLEHVILSHTVPSVVVRRRPFSPAGARIKVAYLSDDFCNHAMMLLIRQTFLLHDRDRFEIGLFSYTPPQKAAEREGWPDVLKESIVDIHGLSDAEAADTLSRWGVDILVDLKGFTAGARLGIVMLSDAPAKATWIGFPGSVAGVGLDYTLVDAVVAPDTSRPFYDEKLCRLPENYFANDGLARPLPGPARRADHGLPEDAFVYASFNGAMKLNRETVDLWASILRDAPGSILWCMAPVAARTNLLAAFAAQGIEADRLVFAEALPYEAHISRAALADVALDTFPCNGHTTTTDMLWAGVPVVTRSGSSLASRVSRGLLRAIGLEDLAVSDADSYRALAISLAREPQRLAEVKARLAENARIMPLFDTERETRHLEIAFEMMAERARAGLAADHIDVPALPPRKSPFR